MCGGARLPTSFLSLSSAMIDLVEGIDVAAVEDPVLAVHLAL